MARHGGGTQLPHLMNDIQKYFEIFKICLHILDTLMSLNRRRGVVLHTVVVDARSDVVDVTLYESVVNPERVETRLGDLEGLRFD